MQENIKIRDKFKELIYEVETEKKHKDEIKVLREYSKISGKIKHNTTSNEKNRSNFKLKLFTRKGC